EPLVGSGTGGRLTTTAKREGDTWVLNGQKRWIGNAPWCDMSIIWARDLADNQVKGFIVENKLAPWCAPRAPLFSQLVLGLQRSCRRGQVPRLVPSPQPPETSTASVIPSPPVAHRPGRGRKCAGEQPFSSQVGGIRTVSSCTSGPQAARATGS